MVVTTANEMEPRTGGGMVVVMSGGVPMMEVPGISLVTAGRMSRVGLQPGIHRIGGAVSGGGLPVDGMTGSPVDEGAAATLLIQPGRREVTGNSQERTKLKMEEEWTAEALEVHLKKLKVMLVGS